MRLTDKVTVPEQVMARHRLVAEPGLESIAEALERSPGVAGNAPEPRAGGADAEVVGEPPQQGADLLTDLDEAQVDAINEARRTAREPGGFFLGDNLYDDSTASLSRPNTGNIPFQLIADHF